MKPSPFPSSWLSDLLVRLRTALADRYTIERELGRGGMATVYLAHDPKHDRPVAVKVLRPELAASLGTARFLQEIKFAARLSHPHILPLHDSGDADGFLYYVMPFVEGKSLRDRLDRRSSSCRWKKLSRLPAPVAGALDYAHATMSCIGTSSRRTSCSRRVTPSSVTSALPGRSPPQARRS